MSQSSKSSNMSASPNSSHMSSSGKNSSPVSTPGTGPVSSIASSDNVSEDPKPNSPKPSGVFIFTGKAKVRQRTIKIPKKPVGPDPTDNVSDTVTTAAATLVSGEEEDDDNDSLFGGSVGGESHIDDICANEQASTQAAEVACMTRAAVPSKEKDASPPATTSTTLMPPDDDKAIDMESVVGSSDSGVRVPNTMDPVHRSPTPEAQTPGTDEQTNDFVAVSSTPPSTTSKPDTSPTLAVGLRSGTPNISVDDEKANADVDHNPAPAKGRKRASAALTDMETASPAPAKKRARKNPVVESAPIEPQKTSRYEEPKEYHDVSGTGKFKQRKPDPTPHQKLMKSFAKNRKEAPMRPPRFNQNDSRPGVIKQTASVSKAENLPYQQERNWRRLRPIEPKKPVQGNNHRRTFWIDENDATVSHYLVPQTAENFTRNSGFIPIEKLLDDAAECSVRYPEIEIEEEGDDYHIIVRDLTDDEKAALSEARKKERTQLRARQTRERNKALREGRLRPSERANLNTVRAGGVQKSSARRKR